ncbi:hypothetical protein MLF92_16860 [Escherichia coli]|nr:hypothetical protein [Escherichia coli]MCN2838818.1 hypothetical protein [Escherichia coli]MCN4693474.1 hypothetical protein [Escherichia coli]MCN7826991.1 hypothetical protein [Escherichia coli]
MDTSGIFLRDIPHPERIQAENHQLWYSKELEMSIARLENEKAAIQAQHEVVLDRIREMQNDNRGF